MTLAVEVHHMDAVYNDDATHDEIRGLWKSKRLFVDHWEGLRQRGEL